MKKDRKVPGRMHTCTYGECGGYNKGTCEADGKKCTGKEYVLAGSERKKVVRELEKWCRKQMPTYDSTFTDGVMMICNDLMAELERIGGGR